MFQQTHELIGNISESSERFFKIPCKDRERTQVTSIHYDADVMSILPGKKFACQAIAGCWLQVTSMQCDADIISILPEILCLPSFCRFLRFEVPLFFTSPIYLALDASSVPFLNSRFAQISLLQELSARAQPTGARQITAGISFQNRNAQRDCQAARGSAILSRDQAGNCPNCSSAA